MMLILFSLNSSNAGLSKIQTRRIPFEDQLIQAPQYSILNNSLSIDMYTRSS